MFPAVLQHRGLNIPASIKTQIPKGLRQKVFDVLLVFYNPLSVSKVTSAKLKHLHLRERNVLALSGVHQTGNLSVSFMPFVMLFV